MLLRDLDDDKTLRYRTRLRLGPLFNMSTYAPIGEALEWCRTMVVGRWEWALGDIWCHVHFELHQDEAMFRLFRGAQRAGTKLLPGTVRRTRRNVASGRRRTAM